MNGLSRRELRRLPDWDDPQQCRFHAVTVDLQKCDGCRLCALVCPANVLEHYGPKGAKKVRVKADTRGCMSCNNCRAVCDNDAIEATESYGFTGYYRRLGLGGFSPPRVF